MKLEVTYGCALCGDSFVETPDLVKGKYAEVKDYHCTVHGTRMYSSTKLVEDKPEEKQKTKKKQSVLSQSGSC